MKKQIADAHNLCQCLKDSVDDLESLVDTALDAAADNSETPTEGSRRASTTPRTKAAIGRQFHQAKSTTQNLLKALQRGGGSFASEEAVGADGARSKAAEILNLEEANQDLREEVDRLTTELQSATGLHTAWEQQMAALEAEAAELHAEVGALRNLLNEKNVQNAKYRGILSENQSAAASARDELERLVEEVEGKDLLISQLHQKLKKATARLQQAQTAGNTIYSTTEDEDESGALKAIPRAGRHGAHPPRPHRKFHRHRTPSSASEGDVTQQHQQQQWLSGKWSGSRGDVTGRSLDEDEADDPADAVEVDGVLPAVGLGFPAQPRSTVDTSYAFSGPGLIDNATPPPLLKPVATNTVATQFDASALPAPTSSSAFSHFPTPDPSSGSSDVLPLNSLVNGDPRRLSATSSKLRLPIQAETQTDLELLIGFVENFAFSSSADALAAPSRRNVGAPSNAILKPSSAPDSNARVPDEPASVSAQASRVSASFRKCLFPEHQRQYQPPRSSASPPLRSSAIDDDAAAAALLVDEDVTASASEADADDSVLQSVPPRVAAKTSFGSGGVGGANFDESVAEMESVRTRLRDSELVNRTLKEELEVVNALLAAVGDESKMDASASTSQTEDDATNVLKAHLAEMRRLRKQLENQIQTHRNLGDNIEEQMRNREMTDSPTTTTTTTTAAAGLRTDIYLRQSPIGRTNDDLRRHNSVDGSGENNNSDDAGTTTTTPGVRDNDEETAAAALRAELETARAEAELSRAETESARRDQRRAEEESSRAAGEAERKLRDATEKLGRQSQQRQKALSARAEAVEADNARLRRTATEKDRELVETKKALKETKDLVDAVKTELAILSKMKKERRAKEKKSELEFTTEYMKEMEKLREQLREAVKENQRLRHRLEGFQVPNANNGRPSSSSGTKTFVGQEVHVHHDCASSSVKVVKTSSPNGKSALPNGNGALPDGILHPARDRSAPSSRPPASGGGGGSATTRLRRRSHSSSEGEDGVAEREEGRRVGGGSRGDGGSRSRELRRGSDSGLWSLTGALNGVGGNGNDVENVDRGLNGIMTADRLQLTPSKKSQNSSHNSSHHSPKNDSSYLINEKDRRGIRVSGDLRYLFAVGRLDDLELLKKEVAESRVVIEGLHAVAKDRLAHLNATAPDKNPEFGLLRKMEVGFSNLSTLLGEVERLGAEFWTSTLPANGGEKVTSKENVDKTHDKSRNGESEEILILKCKLKTQERLLHQAISRLEATNKMKEGIEGEVIKRLTRHYKVLKDARNNLENFHLPAGTEREAT